MKLLIVFACLVLGSKARPEAGYAYSQPTALVQSIGLVQPPRVYHHHVPAVHQHQQAPIVTSTVHKHVYVHVPPPDEEELIARQPVAPIINHQKHYKIIFIRAPTSPSISEQIIRQQQQSLNEEKTIVYVLVKKPDSIADIQKAQAGVRAPSKPEVFFIKYKTEKEHGVQTVPGLLPPHPVPVVSAPAILPAPAVVPASVASGSDSLSLAQSPIVVTNDSYDEPTELLPPKPSPVYGPPV